MFHVVEHPLVAHKLTLLRRRDTPSSLFRTVVEEISMLLAYEVTRDLQTRLEPIDTPLAHMTARVLDGERVAFVPILRAGNGMLEGMLALLPTARVWHIGIFREHETLRAVEYYCKLPASLDGVDAIVIDPMLATAGSAAAAIDRLKSSRPRSVRFACLIAAPEGVRALSARCTHRGCTVEASGTEFACPCHRARFAADGAVVSGPARDPLPALPAKLADGQVWLDASAAR